MRRQAAGQCNLRSRGNDGLPDRLHTTRHQPSKPISTHQFTLSNSDDGPSEIHLAVVPS